MRCTSCHRKLLTPPLMLGRYPYGPVCFNKMFPKSISGTKRASRGKVAVKVDDATPDLFDPFYFDSMGALHAQQLGATA